MNRDAIVIYDMLITALVRIHMHGGSGTFDNDLITLLNETINEDDKQEHYDTKILISIREAIKTKDYENFL